MTDLTKKRWFLFPIILGAFVLTVSSLFLIPHEVSAEVRTHVSSFPKSTGTGAQSVTGLGFKPKAIIFYAATTSLDTLVDGDLTFGVGFAASSTSGVTGGAVSVSDEGAATSDTYTYASSSKSILLLNGLTGAVTASADVTSFDADGFTVNWRTSNSFFPAKIHYVAVGGADITNAKSGQFSVTPGTGASSTTGVGFKPDFLMFIGGATTTFAQNIATDDGRLSLGIAVSSTQGSIEQAGWGLINRDNQGTSDSCNSQSATSAIVIAGPGASTCPATDAFGSVTSFDSDGFTINKSDGPTASSTFFYLALKGGDHQVGSFNSPTVAGATTTAGIGQTPNLLFVTSWATSTAGPARVNANFSIGAATSSAWGETIAYFSQDADGTLDPDLRMSASSSAQKTFFNGFAGNGVLDATASLVSLDTDGFTINWGNPPGGVWPILYWTVGHKPAVTALATGTQATALGINSANQHVGGAFLLQRNTSSTNISQITLNEEGTVNANSNLSNVDIYYENDATQACSYGGGETLYGTDAAFDGSDVAVVTGSMTVSSSTPTCVYVVLDVGAGASAGETVEIEISNPSTDIIAAYGSVSSTAAVAISGSSTLGASTISVSGNCKQFDQSTNCTDAETVRVAVNGSLQAQTGTTASGAWSISSVSQPTSGDVITVFIDGVASSSRAAAVTKWDGSGNITGVVLYEGHLTLGSDDNATTTNANLSSYDNSVSSDPDLFFDVDASANLTLDSNNIFSNDRLLIRQNNTHQPHSSGTQVVIAAQNLQASSTARIIANGSIFRLGQNFVNNGTFTEGTSTIEFSGATSTLDCASCVFYNLTASGTATLAATSSFNVVNNLHVATSGVFSINSSRTVTASSTVTLNGTISGSGTLTITDSSTGPGTSGTLSSVVRYDASSANVASTVFDARTYGGLVETYASSASSMSLILPSGTFTFDGGLNVIAGGAGNTTLYGTSTNPTVDVNGSLDFTGSGSGSEIIRSGTGTWSVSTNADFTSGTYTAATGTTLKMDGTGTLTPNSNDFWNLEVNSAGTVTILSGVTTTLRGNLTLAGAGTPVFTSTTILMTSSSATIDGGGKTINNLVASSSGTFTLQNTDLTIDRRMEVSTGTTFSISSGINAVASTTLILNGTVSGSGRLTYQSATTFPTSGTVSSILRFDATSNAQTLPSRSYGGQIEIYNSGVTNRTVTVATGTYTFGSGVYLYAEGTASTTLDASTNIATGTITAVDFLGSGGGQETILLGAGPWTISGALDISSGNFRAPTSTLNLGGNYTNTSGVFTHSTGTVVLNGSSQQTFAGTMDGGSAFHILTITNNSGNEGSPSVKFNASTTAATSTIATASTTVQFQASSTFTFTNINWNGQATTTQIKLRSSASSTTRWLLNVSLSGGQAVSYVNVKDSDASAGEEIAATDGTNTNSSGNTNWVFAITAPTATSTGNDTFEVNAVSTTISSVNLTSGAGSPAGRFSSSSDIRLIIPNTFNALWDESVTSVTCAAGSACSKISTTDVTYTSSSRIAIINVIQNFSSGEWVQISGLKMGAFSAGNASTTVLRLRVDGSSDLTNDATDTRSKTVKGTLVMQEHVSGQKTNQFEIDEDSLTAAELFRFRLVPTGEVMNMTTTTITISSANGITESDVTNARLFDDENGDGDIDAGEDPVGASGTVSIASASGTIIFGGTWTVTSTMDVILRVSVQSINDGDNFKLQFTPSQFNVIGATSSVSITITGSSNSINHGKPIKTGAGGGSATPAGGNPPSGVTQGGGGAGSNPPPEGGDPGGGSQGGGGAGGGDGGAP